MSNLNYRFGFKINFVIATVSLIGFLMIVGPIQNANSQSADTIANHAVVDNRGITNKVSNNSSVIEGVTVRIVPGATLLTDTAYNPNPIKIMRGQTVLWLNEDFGFHTVTSGGVNDPNSGILFDSGLTGPTMLSSKGKTFSYQFNVPGEFPYYCILHPGMVGTVTVT